MKNLRARQFRHYVFMLAVITMITGFAALLGSSMIERYAFTSVGQVNLSMTISPPEDDTDDEDEIIVDEEETENAITPLPAEENHIAIAVNPFEPFLDVAPDDPTFLHAQTLKNIGAIHGIGGDGAQLDPDRFITRAELLKASFGGAAFAEALPVKYTTVNAFSDVSVDHPLTSYIYGASQRGIIQGYEDGTFRPDVPPTFSEVSKVLLKKNSEVPPLDGYVTYADELGITKHFDEAPELNSQVSRREVIGMVYEMLMRKGSERTPEKIAILEQIISEELDMFRSAQSLAPDAARYDAIIRKFEIQLSLLHITIVEK